MNVNVGLFTPTYSTTTGTYYPIDNVVQYPPVSNKFLGWEDIINDFNFKSKLDTPKYPKSSCYIAEDGTINLNLAVTGFSKENLSIKREGEKITIIGNKEKDTEKTPVKKVWSDISQKNFETIFSFNEKMNLEKITINLENGILSIVVPMHEENKPVVKELEIL
jgi:HSP20 family molecular chaperone IbpA